MFYLCNYFISLNENKKKIQTEFYIKNYYCQTKLQITNFKYIISKKIF